MRNFRIGTSRITDGTRPLSIGCTGIERKIASRKRGSSQSVYPATFRSAREDQGFVIAQQVAAGIGLSCFPVDGANLKPASLIALDGRANIQLTSVRLRAFDAVRSIRSSTAWRGQPRSPARRSGDTSSGVGHTVSNRRCSLGACSALPSLGCFVLRVLRERSKSAQKTS